MDSMELTKQLGNIFQSQTHVEVECSLPVLNGSVRVLCAARSFQS